MKRLGYGLLALALGLSIPSTGLAYDPPAPPPGSGINDTVHDLGHEHNGMFYTAVPADYLERICIYCHAPHNTYRLPGTGIGAGPEAPEGYDYLPLWNHMPTTNTFIMYENGPGAPIDGPKASQAIAQAPIGPSGTSMLCLSCHDGSIAINEYGNEDQPELSQGAFGGAGAFIDHKYVIGKDTYLGNHHPISFNYYEVQAIDTEINPADAVSFTINDTVQDHLYGDGKLECGTCHSVHNTGNTGESLLWRSDYRSELCLTCHAKGQYTPPPGGPVEP